MWIRDVLAYLVVALMGAVSVGGQVIAAPAQPRLVPTIGHTNKIGSLSYSSNGRFLISGASDGILILWDVETGAELKRYLAMEGVMHVQFCDRDQKLFAGYEDGKARIWDVLSGKEVRSFQGSVAALAHDYLYGDPFAISADGALVATADKQGTVHLWDGLSGHERDSWPAKLGDIGYLRISPSSGYVLAGGANGAALFDARTHQSQWVFKDDTGAVAFASKANLALTSGNDGVHIRQMSDGRSIKTIPFASAFSLTLSPDDTKLLAGGFTNGGSMWDIASAKPLWDLANIYGSNLLSSLGVAFAPDGQSLAAAPIDRRMGSWDSEIDLVSTGDHHPIRALQGRTARLLSVGFKGHTPYVLAADVNGRAFLWPGGSRSIALTDHISPVITGALSPDAQHVALGSLDQSGSVWTVLGKELFRLDRHSQYVGDVTFSHDGKYAFSSGGAGFGWSVETGAAVAQFGTYSLDGAVLGITPTGADQYVVTQAFGHTEFWTREGRQADMPRDLLARVDAAGASTHLSSDGRLLTLPCPASVARLDTTRYGFRTECAGSFAGEAVGVSKDGAWVLSSKDNLAYLQRGATRLSFDQGQLVNFMALSEDNALLLTGSLQDDVVHLWDVQRQAEICRIVLLRSGTWVVFDEEGRFDTDDISGIQGLVWLLPNDPLRPLPLEIFMKDYFFPNLITRKLAGGVAPVESIAAPETTTPKLTIDKIDVDPATRTALLQIAVQGAGPGSEAYDLHVFRDGQLVARVPEDGGSVRQRQAGDILSVSDIQLPWSASAQDVKFTAYAFNRQHIKGQTTQKTLTLDPDKGVHAPTAYVVTFGVNTFDDPAWNLDFAASDARRLSDVVSRNLERTSQFGKVVRTSFASDTVTQRGELPATRTNLRLALEALSARLGDQGARPALPGVALQRARPEDLVIIHIATHGYADTNGEFYMLPADIGVNTGGKFNAELRSKAISSDDLSAWLQGIDSRNIVLILDTCQSAGVTGKDFKPAPIGDRSFGQLVFNKKIRLLVGAQADGVSLEADHLKHGLLSYALVEDGLERQSADFQPLDHSITLSEWLQFAVDDVKRIQQSTALKGQDTSGVNGAKIAIKKRAQISVNGEVNIAEVVQTPVLFDFGGDSAAPVVWGHPFFNAASGLSKTDADLAELAAAKALKDPVAAAGAFRRFIARQTPGIKSAVAWALLTDKLLDARAPSTELISSTRLALAHLMLVKEYGSAAAILEKSAGELQRRHEYPEVQSEFRGIVKLFVPTSDDAGMRTQRH